MFAAPALHRFDHLSHDFALHMSNYLYDDSDNFSLHKLYDNDLYGDNDDFAIHRLKYCDLYDDDDDNDDRAAAILVLNPIVPIV